MTRKREAKKEILGMPFSPNLAGERILGNKEAVNSHHMLCKV